MNCLEVKKREVGPLQLTLQQQEGDTVTGPHVGVFDSNR